MARVRVKTSVRRRRMRRPRPIHSQSLNLWRLALNGVLVFKSSPIPISNNKSMYQSFLQAKVFLFINNPSKKSPAFYGQPMFAGQYENGFRFFINIARDLPHLASEGISVTTGSIIYSAIGPRKVFLKV